jgi:7-keto-8-aminopelargonate synthetase-like enzyme
MTNAQHRKQVLAALEAHKQRSLSEPGYARRFLISTGIYTENGDLAPEYGGPKLKKKAKA